MLILKVQRYILENKFYQVVHLPYTTKKILSAQQNSTSAFSLDILMRDELNSEVYTQEVLILSSVDSSVGEDMFKGFEYLNKITKATGETYHVFIKKSR